jgi:hypothetical protein
MESRSGRPGRDAEQFGDLDEGQADVVVEYEDGPLLHREPTVRTLELIAVRDRVGIVGRRWPADGQDSDVRPPRLSPLRLVVAGMNEDSMDPRLEAIRVAKMREPLPGQDEGVLQSVLGSTAVAQDPEGDGVEDVTDLMHQDGERLTVAPTGPLDEVLIHPSTSVGPEPRGPGQPL